MKVRVQIPRSGYVRAFLVSRAPILTFPIRMRRYTARVVRSVVTQEVTDSRTQPGYPSDQFHLQSTSVLENATDLAGAEGGSASPEEKFMDDETAYYEDDDDKCFDEQQTENGWRVKCRAQDLCICAFFPARWN